MIRLFIYSIVTVFTHIFLLSFTDNIRHIIRMQNQLTINTQNEPQISTKLYLKSLLSIKLTAICSYCFASLIIRQKLPYLFPILTCFSFSILLPHPTKSYFNGKKIIQKIKQKFKPQSEMIYQKMTFQDFVTYSQDYKQKKMKQIKIFSQNIKDQSKMLQMKSKMKKIRQQIISQDKINKIKDKIQQKKQKISQNNFSQLKDKISQKRQKIISKVNKTMINSSDDSQQTTTSQTKATNLQQKSIFSADCFVKFLKQITLFRISKYFKGPVMFQDISILTGYYLLRLVSIQVYRRI